MAHLFSGYISTQKLEEILQTVKTKGEKGFRFTGSVNDEPNEHNNNVALFAEQTKEEQQAKKKKYYFSNGRVFWKNNDNVFIPQKQQNLPPAAADGLPDMTAGEDKKDGLPF